MSTSAEIWAHRSLLGNLVRRDLTSKYKKSILGWAWSLLSPAASLGVYSLVFGVILRGNPPIAGNGTTQVFALWLFCGLVVWNAFNSMFAGAMDGFTAAGPLLTKIYFPPECPSIAGTSAVLLQTSIETAILLGLLAIAGNISWTVIFVPLVIAQIMAFSLGLGMIAGLWNTRYRDVSYITTILLQLLFYATPILYGFDIVPDTAFGWLPARTLLNINPITHFVGEFRSAIYFLEAPSLGSFTYATLASFGTLLVGWRIFSRNAPQIIEEL